MIRCILFDRDGTLGELTDKRYPETFVPFCDIKNVFTALRRKGYYIGIITNQSSIARGTGNAYDFDKEFTNYGVDVYEICPHDNADNCNCRKPKSGLLLNAAKRLNISPTSCIVVGDRESDVLCAKNVGAKAVFVLSGYGENEKERVVKKHPEVPILKRFDEIINIL